MELRPARPEELDAVGAITLAAYEEYTSGPDDGYRLRLLDAARRSREAELWVAVEGEQVLGSVTCCPPGSPWRELATSAEEGEFRMLSVHPDHRGHGTGAALAVLGEQRAREHGATRMVLSSLAQMAAAHRIYTRLGYRRAPALDWSPDVDVHLIAFTKELT